MQLFQTIYNECLKSEDTYSKNAHKIFNLLAKNPQFNKKRIKFESFFKRSKNNQRYFKKR